MNKLEFEWDDNKKKRNMRIYKIDFSTAAHVFADECRIEKYDGKHSENEERKEYYGYY